MPCVPARLVGRACQRGFSLIEALFSALILAIALLGLAGFQVAAMSDASLVKARSVGVSLAQEKLDDLRGFTRLADDPATTTINECATPTFCFSEIAQNAGGAEESGGALVLPSGNVAGYLDGYSIAWTVTCSAETAGSALAFSASCSDADAKLATVTVSWTDSKGAGQTVSLQGVIYAMDPARMAGGLARSFSSAKPVASYTPIGVPDGVPVPINTGGSQYKESSKPLPEVSQSGTGIEVSFDSVIYSGGDGNYTKDSQEEFATVGCECQFSSGEGYTPTRKVWNGRSLEVKAGEKVPKAVGIPLDNQAPDACTVCCRDHHDRADSSDPKYDPQRPASDYTGGNHKHYWYTDCVGQANCSDSAKNTSLASATPFTEVTSGAYLESCRVMRTDGFWRVLQDWELRKVTILPYNFLLDTGNLTNYVGLVTAVVKNAVTTDSGNGGITPDPLSGRDLSLSPGDKPVQLLARAVYVDKIYSEDDPSSLDTAYYTALLEKISAGGTDWLESAAFYEANLTLLYDWTSSETSIATVSSEPISAIYDPTNGYYGSFSRGKVTVQSGTSAGSTTITARARLANSGITGGVNRTGSSYVAGVSYGTDIDDNAKTLIDTITVNRLAEGSSHSIIGKVLKGNSSVNVAEAGSPLTVTANTSSGSVMTACAPQAGDADANAWYFSCKVSDNWTGTLTFSSTGKVYTFGDSSSDSYTTSEIKVSGTYTAADVKAYGAYATLRGYVGKDDNPSGNPQPDVTASSTTITFTGATATGTCSDKAVVGSGTNAKLSYSCVVPTGWTGAITVLVDSTIGGYTYLSPGNTPCTGTTAGSCTMLTITSALADIDGTSAAATETQKQQTNVTARR